MQNFERDLFRNRVELCHKAFSPCGVTFNYHVEKGWFNNIYFDNNLWRSESCKGVSLTWQEPGSEKFFDTEEFYYDGQKMKSFRIGRLHLTFTDFWHTYPWIED